MEHLVSQRSLPWVFQLGIVQRVFAPFCRIGRRFGLSVFCSLLHIQFDAAAVVCVLSCAQSVVAARMILVDVVVPRSGFG
ncbi:hypothetical protein ACFOYZ_29225, partial [Neobacillus cucumis]|uniref:hypothetical protein n=1 Tax=Neobacillus cucumis TaxID=1740721 RepID=UPI00361AA8EC